MSCDNIGEIKKKDLTAQTVMTVIPFQEWK